MSKDIQSKIQNLKSQIGMIPDLIISHRETFFERGRSPLQKTGCFVPFFGFSLVINQKNCTVDYRLWTMNYGL
ncbi:hypothetical protein FACHB389_27055 [Nostoc calcicola FACHB-389]|nr:hypothetical protein FACHB389_27055 [Nostoc calcicola FACHB-389]